MKVKKIVANLFVEAIEPCIPFWERVNFRKTTEVPEGDRLGFVILEKDGLEIMYQTRASVKGDVPVLAETPMKGTMLFIEVDDIDVIDQALEGVERVVPRRKTFYGAEEVIVREPAGNTVAFAQFG